MDHEITAPQNAGYSARLPTDYERVVAATKAILSVSKTELIITRQYVPRGATRRDDEPSESRGRCLAVKKCIFCGQRGLTKEDVWPKWIGRTLSKMAQGPLSVSLESSGRSRKRH